MSDNNNLPTTIVIFGASGDLTQRKLVPALYSQFCKDRLPDELYIVGIRAPSTATTNFASTCARAWRSTPARALTKAPGKNLPNRSTTCPAAWPRSMKCASSMKPLREYEGGDANRLYYLSISPKLYSEAVENLGKAEMVNRREGWSRLIVEKPFGTDLETAQALNRDIHAVFDESQVYRIDHYLGKETAQNILFFPLCQHDFRAIVEPHLRRQRADHRGRGCGRGAARQLLRYGGRRARYDPEPPDAAACARRHGAARLV